MEDSSSVSRAIDSWIGAIGPDKVITDPELVQPYANSVCASRREIPCILKPGSADDVRKIVQVANRFLVPLYPVSCGRQWGMGSRLPVQTGSVIVDLSGMNRILEISERFHYVVVEPGVTQKQLIDHIKEKNLSLMLNVTGSTSDTSLIGNAMDRGVGYFNSRAEGISNMAVVLGNGETIQTGFGHFEGAKTQNLYHHGIGPSLDGLFPQGNFGIVTSACIDLMPKPEAHMAVIAKIDSEEKLPALIEALAGLRSRGIFQTVAHIGNRERSYITLSPLLYEQLMEHGETPGAELRARVVQMLEKGGFGPWSAAIGVLGTKVQLKLAKKEFKKALHGIAKTMFLNDSIISTAKAASSRLSFIPYVREQRMLLLAVEPVYNFTRGETTDKSLKAVYWPAGDFDNLDEPDPDQSNSGLLFCLPIIPAIGNTVLEVVTDTRETFARHGFEAAITVNLMDTKAMEGVVSLAFDRRNEEQAKAAHDCIQEMEARYIETGYPPYRVGINSMHQVVKEDDTFWQTVRDLKKVLDPNNIIAPGRYNLI
ncbi:MAG: FAD-binding oxidoreductase [Kiritimatiellales bacterium]|nr:FAD-binding oxidoreductase [Kiritimatiellales bacterium]